MFSSEVMCLASDSEYLRCFCPRPSIRTLLYYHLIIHYIIIVFLEQVLLCSFVRLPLSILLLVLLLSRPISTARVRSHYIRTDFLRRDRVASFLT